MKNFEKLLEAQKEIHLLSSISSVLNWDQQCVMPIKAMEYRGTQIAYINQLAHEKLISKKYENFIKGALDDTCSLSASDPRRISAEKSFRKFERVSKIPPKLVKELSIAGCEGYGAWQKARQEDNFSVFKPSLAKIVDLNKELIKCYGYDGQPYDALMPDYEWGSCTRDLDQLFGFLRRPLADLAIRLTTRADYDLPALYHASYPISKQEQIAKELAEEIGFDFNNGSMFTSAHPFSTTLGKDDFRITTRYLEGDLISSFLAVAHEVGHSLYERGLPDDYFGTTVGAAASFGIHESQSLFWEKRIACSYPFLRHWHKTFRELFGGIFKEIDSYTLYKAVNRVKSSLIRVDADELTYTLHIIIRYELEKLIINEDLPIEEIPIYWNKKYHDYLGITPDSDVTGCLQDIHWAYGSFGYFPSYALGHIYSAQFTQQLESDLGNLDDLIANREYDKILSWYRAKVHNQGKLLDARELVYHVTKEEVNAKYFLDYITDKVAKIYDINPNRSA